MLERPAGRRRDGSGVPAYKPGEYPKPNPFDGLKDAKGVVLAVSGGPDSTALMLLAAEWIKFGGRPPVFVATVDHGLRPAARAEAEAVALWSRALGLPHRILSWEGEKPKTRIQERARDARYALLRGFAAEVGADHLVTAHHADDQAETILLRLFRGSGLKGLAGMNSLSTRDGLVLLRPVLDWTKEELIDVCLAHNHPFFEDPSNKDPAYARARLRRLCPLLADEGLDRDALLRLGRRAARAEAALHARAMALSRSLPNCGTQGEFKADISVLRPEPEAVFERILCLEIEKRIGPYLRLERLEALAARMKTALERAETCTATLGGVILRLDRNGILSIKPEGSRRRGLKTA